MAPTLLIPTQHLESFTTNPCEPHISSQYSNEFEQTYLLPIELFNDVIEKVYYDQTEAESITAQLDNFSKTISPVNKLFHHLATRLLYRYCVFTRPNSFQVFLNNLTNDPSLGLHVKFLDFMEFTSIGLGRTGKMNQEIQMVTNTTIYQCLKSTPNLTEFLASESIDTDIDLPILDILFNHMKDLRSLDFCGATNLQFVELFKQLRIAENNYSISRISFHECTNIPLSVFIHILPSFPHLTRLDLSHTLVSAKILSNFLHPELRLTHLSLLRCSNLTTGELMEFLIHHQSVNEGSLKWLNLLVESTSVLREEQLSILLKKLELPDLGYLNLGGMPVNMQHLNVILEKFPKLEAIGLCNVQIELSEIIDFLKRCKNLKVIDLSLLRLITKWTVDQSVLLDACPTLEAFEISGRLVDELPYHLHTPLSVWKTFDNNRSSRRAWIYRVSEEERTKILADPYYNSDMINNLVFYDTTTGKKIKKIVRPPTFLKYSSKKMNCSIGFFDKNETYLDNDIFPVEYSERGIYKYYSLNR